MSISVSFLKNDFPKKDVNVNEESEGMMCCDQHNNNNVVAAVVTS